MKSDDPRNMCGRGAGTHGDVLNVHTEGVLSGHTGGDGGVGTRTHVFSQDTTHNNTRGQRETERDRETERREREIGETRQDKRGEKREETRKKMKDKRQDKRSGDRMKRREEDKIKRREEKIKRDTMCYVRGCVVLTCPVFCSKLPDPRIISNFQNYHYHSESILIFPITFCF